jgi:hypothetical protein
MAAFLLSWNPDKFAWEDLRKTIARVQRKGSVTGRWSCGNRTDMPKGSEFFLIRLGPALKGIVGRGVTTSVPFEDTHWNPEKRRLKIKALYVKTRYTDLRETPVIPWEELQQHPLSRFKWSIFASGIALPEVIVDELKRRWDAARAVGTTTTTGAGAGVLSSHPFADEWTQDAEILEQAGLSPTDKQALIKARRGQGIFRANVLNMEPQCRITKIADPAHLRASHIKPWSVSSNAERLAASNGLMLAPHIDHLFDRGFISFTDNGDLLISPKCSAGVLAAWGISSTMNVGPFRLAQRPYLAHHRAHILKH